MNAQTLKAIVRRGYESKDLDYKGPFEWDEKNKKACCELVKDILAMANTGGGFLVIGVAEIDSKFEWVGLTKEQLSSFETSRVNRFLQNYADPPINCIVAKTEDSNVKYVVIQIPSFPDTPHICQKEYPGVLSTPALYVRTDNNESAELKSSSDFRHVVELAIRRRSDSLLESMRAILTGPASSTSKKGMEEYKKKLNEALLRFSQLDPYKGKGYKSYREMWCHPVEYQNELASLEQLRLAAERAHVDFTGWPFLFISRARPDVTSIMKDGYETLIAFSDFDKSDRVDFWRLHQDLFFFHKTLADEESYSQNKKIERWAEITWMTQYICEGIHCVTKLYDGILDSTASVSVSFRLTGTENLKLDTIDPRRAHLVLSHVSRMPEISLTRVHPLADWSAGLIDHSVDICKYIFQRFNWEEPNLHAIRETIQKTLSRGL